MSIEFMTVIIGIGKGYSLGISETDELMLNYNMRDDMRVTQQMGTGVRSQKELDHMIEYLNRLRIHLPE